MSDKYYMNLGGKAMGPYSLEQLVSLRDRGKLTPDSRISTDRRLWKAAATLLQIFPDSAAQPGSRMPQTASTAPAAPKWFFSQGDREQGPVEWSLLVQMAAAGRLGPKDMIWTESFSDWQPAGSVEGLFPRGEMPVPRRTTADDFHSSSRKATLAHVVADFQDMNFMAEVFPVDQRTLSSLKSNFAFLAVALLGVVPLFVGTLQKIEWQLTGFALFFAATWGVLFKKFIIEETEGWALPIAALFFTGLIGMRLLLLTYEFHPESYRALPQSESLFTRLLGSILHTGINEELCKIIPVLGYILWKRGSAKPLTIVLVGVFSGLGFAAFENLSYAVLSVVNAADLTSKYGVEGLVKGVQHAMVNNLLRSISLVFFHGVHSGIFASFIALAHVTRKHRVALFVVGLAVSATLHGFYNWSAEIQSTAPAMITAFGFVLFYAYLTKLRLVVASYEGTGETGPNPYPSPPSTDQCKPLTYASFDALNQ